MRDKDNQPVHEMATDTVVGPAYGLPRPGQPGRARPFALPLTPALALCGVHREYCSLSS